MPSLIVFDSHAYRGCAVRVTGLPRDHDTWDADVRFDDGAESLAVCERLDSTTLSASIDSYRTAKGTRIPPKEWVITIENRRSGEGRISGQIAVRGAKRGGRLSRHMRE